MAFSSFFTLQILPLSIKRQAHFPSFGTGFQIIKASKVNAGSYLIN